MGERNKQTLRMALGCGAIALAVVVVSAVAGFIFIERMYVGETPVTRIANYDEWLEKGGDTWLEVSMPKSVRDLCEVHNIDSNSIYAKFYIAPEDIDELAKGYTEIIQENTATWPPSARVFIRERFPCAVCAFTQDRLVVDVKTGFAEFTSRNSQVFGGSSLGEYCSAL